MQVEDIVSVLVSNGDIASQLSTLENIFQESGYNPVTVVQKMHLVVREMAETVSEKLHEVIIKEEKRLVEHKICQTRKCLEKWWIKCHLSEDQRMSFAPFHSSDLNIDILKLHELELEKLIRYYEENKIIITMVEQYCHLHGDLIDIENRFKDPNRLFDNRGGQLLKDEQNRKIVRGQLPKLEKKIKKLGIDFFVKNNFSFTMNGNSIEKIIADYNSDDEHKSSLKHRKFDSQSLENLAVVSANTCRKVQIANDKKPLPSLGSTSSRLPVFTRVKTDPLLGLNKRY